MSAPWIVIAAIVGVGMLYVLLPVAADTFHRFRGRRSLRCPTTGEEAEVEVDARRAALGSIVGRLLLRVKGCSLWPERQGCAEECVKLPEVEGGGSRRPQ
jgi:hypothetical protein